MIGLLHTINFLQLPMVRYCIKRKYKDELDTDMYSPVFSLEHRAQVIHVGHSLTTDNPHPIAAQSVKGKTQDLT